MLVQTKYGIVLKKLQIQDIELVRRWRNDPEIVRYMEYRKYISIDDQKKWFLSLSEHTDFYFVAIYKKQKIGLVNLKNVNYKMNTAEWGIFIGNKKYINGLTPVAVAFSIIDYGFEVLYLNTITAHILQNNKRAIRLNKTLGFQLQNGQSSVDNQLYVLAKDEYYTKTKRYKKVIMNAII
jgi:UDP-4-amino-4,6-dideoxy-N-acetyl-beta-L-altrosamine N-acetyltransferase